MTRIQEKLLQLQLKATNPENRSEEVDELEGRIQNNRADVNWASQTLESRAPESRALESQILVGLEAPEVQVVRVAAIVARVQVGVQSTDPTVDACACLTTQLLESTPMV